MRFWVIFFMQTAAEFISDFIRGPFKTSSEEDVLRAALTGLIGLDKSSLHEGVVRKLIAALRKKKCKVDTPRNKDPFEVLVKWIAAAPVTVGQSSWPVNNRSQEQDQNRSAPEGAKRKTGRKRRPSSSASEDEPAPVNNGGGPSNSNNAANSGEPVNNNNAANTGETPPNNPVANTLSPLVSDGGSGANAVGGNQAPPLPTAQTLDINTNSGGSAADTPNTAKGVVIDQQSYVSFLGLMDRVNHQLDALNAEQARTQEILNKQQPTERPRSPPDPKRSRKTQASRVSPEPKTSLRSPDQQLSPGTRADLSELDRFIGEPFDEGGIDDESRDLQNALSDFSKQVSREDDDVLVLSDQGDSHEDSDGYHASKAKRDLDKAHLKFNGLRPKSERTRAITHQNGFPEAIKWLRSKGISLARFVAGHDLQMRPRDKQELEVLSATLLSLVDQLQPGMVIQMDAADILIRRIMSLCLRDKLDDDYLDVLSNPSGSHLAPLEWLSEANKVYKIVKKAKDSRSASGKTPIPTPRWRRQQPQSKSAGSKAHGRNSHDKSGSRPNRVPAPQRSSHQARGAPKERHDGGRGAGTDASSSSNNN